MSNTKRISATVALFAVILAFTVVTLGAYTHLTDAGLGCPDWPGCYNHMIAPTTFSTIEKAEALYPSMPVHVIKAWTEMVHRYAAGILGLMIFALGIVSIRRRKVPGQPVAVPVVLMGLVIFQALLGMWTVTMKLLPVVVMGHLLGGVTILALLWWFNLKTGAYFPSLKTAPVSGFRVWAVLGIIIVAGQIILGGWTSANYAALVCPNFPYCTTQQFFPQVDFREAFNVFNFTNIHLSRAALITIQMTHRIGAMVTAVYVGLLTLCLMAAGKIPVLRGMGVAMLILLVLQITLGILNVELSLPLPVALLHNFFAALLLMSIITLVYATFRSEKVS